VLIFGGAPLAVTPRLQQRIAALSAPYIVAADGGAHTALAFGLRPDIVIGDLDSLADDTRTHLTGVRFETYPRAKDATDAELAIDHAMRRAPTALLLLGFLNGPRLDMSLANVLLLRMAPQAVLLDERNEASLVRGGEAHSWQPELDEVISLLPLSGDCEGVRATGMRYPLDGETLKLSRTRGISNEPASETVRVSLERGELLITRHFARL
jgi:thiamine pyrophosphokinase